jgi:DNA-binding NtrC family response regulator
MAFVRGGVIGAEDLPEKMRLPPGAREEVDGVNDPDGNGKHSSMREMKSHYARSTLEACGGNRAEAARILEVDRKTLNTLLDAAEPEAGVGGAGGE